MWFLINIQLLKSLSVNIQTLIYWLNYIIIFIFCQYSNKKATILVAFLSIYYLLAYRLDSPGISMRKLLL